MSNVKECADLEIKVTRVSENGSEGETGVFFQVENGKFVQLDEAKQEVVKDSFSMSLQGILTRVSAKNDEVQDCIDYISIAVMNAPHKYVGVGQALYASFGKSFTAKVTRKLFHEGDVFEGYILTKDTYVTTKLEIVAAKPSKFFSRFVDAIKPRTAEDITI